MQCSNEQCVSTIEYTDNEYTILAVFRGTIVGKIAKLTVKPRRNCFLEIDDGRFVYQPTGKAFTEETTTGTITFREYDYALHRLKAKERGDEKPVKFDTIIAQGDKAIVITGTSTRIKDMKYVCPGETYDFQGHEEYHACNHCKGEI